MPRPCMPGIWATRTDWLIDRVAAGVQGVIAGRRRDMAPSFRHLFSLTNTLRAYNNSSFRYTTNNNADLANTTVKSRFRWRILSFSVGPMPSIKAGDDDFAKVVQSASGHTTRRNMDFHSAVPFRHPLGYRSVTVIPRDLRDSGSVFFLLSPFSLLRLSHLSLLLYLHLWTLARKPSVATQIATAGSSRRRPLLGGPSKCQ